MICYKVKKSYCEIINTIIVNKKNMDLTCTRIWHLWKIKKKLIDDFHSKTDTQGC